ncbi:MAG: DUF4159 domain-containing protein [Gemmatimonadales bacterium]|nr:DUF4159 domain-containing protein [Gemmatimonadales bacterium]NIN11845.1 DUF4159 domain-containing protein [Gemmatimonadales bacterium]NIN50395.1 DUF4159 domain-containing protein [Gemmatimonadales bacterium]NIP07859.1 DUF4159 domain-containing protein [Gemmatimonadales bacterium]NIR02064.1 DUF4159 domain-containing protein [Gemmatimonadales bacterium]
MLWVQPLGAPARPQGQRPAREANAQGRAFYFTRAEYTSYGRRRFGSWAVDFPKADRQFLIGLRHLTNIDAYELENPVRLDDPDLRRFPFLYALEVGYMSLTEPEVAGLRDYLLAGGFLVIDDFWGTRQWANFEAEMRRVLPEYDIVDIPVDHALLSAFYHIDEILQVPGRGGGVNGRPTWQYDGYVPALRGIFDQHGRLMVVINWNTDLGDAWEWAEDPWYPLQFSNFAYQLGINMILYGMSH